MGHALVEDAQTEEDKFLIDSKVGQSKTNVGGRKCAADRNLLIYKLNDQCYRQARTKNDSNDGKYLKQNRSQSVHAVSYFTDAGRIEIHSIQFTGEKSKSANMRETLG